MKFQFKALLISACVLLCYADANAQSSFFTPVEPSSLGDITPIKSVRKISIVRLDERAMRTYLLAAPLEFHNNGETLPLDIPMPDGTTETFRIVESPILSDRVAALNPEIKTYAGNGTRHKGAIIRLSLTSTGFNAIILNMDGDNVYFQQYAKGIRDVYFNYFTKDAIVPRGAKQSSCGFNAATDKSLIIGADNDGQNNNVAHKGTSTGGNLTTYRLVMPADAEFTAQNGGTQASGFAAVTAYVNRMTAFYRNELSVSFTLVSDATDVYTNAATDPWDNSDQSLMLTQNQTYVDGKYTDAGYDIGHVWGYVGSSGGGIAFRPSLCQSGSKAGGTSGEGDLTTYAQVFMDQLVFHEVGHQFGMSHSYNSSVPVCTTRNPGTSQEPGSGATIMSYGFTCTNSDPLAGTVGDDDYFTTSIPFTGPILQFHTVSYQQSVTYLATIPGCGTTIATGNTAPVVIMPAAFTIPKSTPFSLTGTASDINGDALTYCWEGTNNGTSTPTGTTLANTAEPPFFRSYSPKTSGTRIYPVLDSILNGATPNYSKGDKLPSVSIATTHNLTVRDNNAAGGGLTFGSVTVSVDGGIGPFLETTNLSGSYASFSTQTITWSVNGTNTATPNVKISLSLDGGLTWPKVLAASTPNDGSEVVTLPNVSTSAARIRVEAIGNIFFDISNNNFIITASPLPLSLISFNALLQDRNTAKLQWSAADEQNIQGYDVEMAKESADFSGLGTVLSKGATADANDYNFTVPGLTQGTYNFRLKINEPDGRSSYSPVRTLKIGGLNDDDVQVYPSPTHGMLQVSLPATMTNARMDLMNNIGQVVMSFAASTESARSINISSLASGVYVLQVISDNDVVIRKKVVKD